MIKITKRTKNDFYLRCNNIKIITDKACKLYVKANHHLKTIQEKFGILDFGQNNKKKTSSLNPSNNVKGKGWVERTRPNVNV